METMDNIRLQVNAVIEDVNSTHDIDELIECRFRLQTILFTIQEAESKEHRNYLDAENARKTEEVRLKLYYVNKENISMNKAEPKAFEAVNTLRELEIYFDAEWKRIKGYRYTIDGFIGAIQQKVAHLRKEHELSLLREGTT